MSMAFRGFLGRFVFVGRASAARGQEPPNCGLQQAEVVKVQDPMGRDRLSVSLPAIGVQSIWAERLYAKKPLKAPAAAVGDRAFVLFEGCDPARPVFVALALS